MRTILLFVIILFSVCILRATGDSTQYLTTKDTILLYTGSSGEKIFEHTIERKQTLFSLAKFYGLSVEELYFYNPGLEAQSLKLYQSIRVPIPNQSIIRYKTPDFNEAEHIPVYYTVQKRETMFRISKIVFEMPMNDIMFRNGMSNTDLKEGQRLFIGWMNINGVPEEFRVNGLGGPINRRNNALRKVFLRNSEGKSLKEDSGAALWKKSGGEGSDFYALHRYAPTNSIIEITNPMRKRRVYAKVVGAIPDTAYGDDVKVIVSSAVANLLGVKDKRFFVKIRYQKK